MKVLKIIVKIGLNALCIATILFLLVGIVYAVQITVMHKKYANIFGYSLFEVMTGSMEPAIQVGDDVIVKLVDNANDIAEGDIVVYEQEDNFIIHRVETIDNNTVITKGDQNNTTDEEIPKEKIVGKVIYVFSKLGIFQSIVRKPYIFIPLIDIVLISALVINFKKKQTEVA